MDKKNMLPAAGPGQISGQTAGIPLSAAIAAASTVPALKYEFAFSEMDFVQVCDLIHRYAGISLAASKKDMVYSRLSRRLRKCGIDNFAQYLLLLKKDKTELEAFINALTTNLTSFFREMHHFDSLVAQMKQMPPGHTFHIWCCAASTGEEPYSLAMTACDTFGTLTPPVRILASDLNTSVLETARQAFYGKPGVEALSLSRVRQYFEPATQDGTPGYRLRPELRRMVEFRQINLLDTCLGTKQIFEAVFCRNVLIYFDKNIQEQVVRKLAACLSPGGMFYAGHSENLRFAADIFEPLGRTVYKRIAVSGNRL